MQCIQRLQDYIHKTTTLWHETVQVHARFEKCSASFLPICNLARKTILTIAIGNAFLAD